MPKLPILKGVALGGVAMLTALAFSPGALAQSETQTYQANLTTLNNSGASGTATVEVDGNQATVTLNTMGTSASLPHAQHIHIGGNNICPTMDAAGEDGLVDTVEGKPSYGGIKISLTTEGDTSADSGLAVDRFPSADADGKVTYTRTFTLPNGVTAEDLENGVIVQHGVSEVRGDKTKYDGEEKTKLGDKSLPQEATLPNSCGELTAMPIGGAATGGGATSGTENLALFAIGGTALLAAGTAIAYRNKLASTAK